MLCEYWQYVSCWAQVERSAKCLSGQSRNSVALSLSLTLKRVQCCHVRWCEWASPPHNGRPSGTRRWAERCTLCSSCLWKALGPPLLTSSGERDKTQTWLLTWMQFVATTSIFYWHISTVCFQTAWDMLILCWTTGLQSEQKSRIPIIHNQGDR